MRKGFIVFLILVISSLSLGFYAFFIEPKKIVLHHYQHGENQSGKALKMIQISDIHLSKSYPTSQLKKIVQKINEEQPDIVVFTGDLFDRFNTYGPVEETTQLLRSIQAPYGKFAVWGNHDYGGGAAASYPTIMEDAGFQLLKNTGTSISVDADRPLYIGGIDDSLLGSSSIHEALENRIENSYTVLLSHEPDIADHALEKDISLILSGHSHGGQIVLPFYRFKNALAEKYYAGFYQLSAQTTLYVNVGLGTTVIPARFGATPEIAVFELYI